MNHLIVSREFPPCAYPQGGIGTYVAHVARLLAEHGETVHVIGEQFKGAPLEREELCDGRLIVHRVPLGRPLAGVANPDAEQRTLEAMRRSAFPAQAFSWQVARRAEALIDSHQIDCIEAQDFEAPLYYFLLRCALGQGPRREPPCFVHLHSPMQFICHHNDWDIGTPGHLMMKRHEDYVIQASDAALCPSAYLARQVERHYQLAAGSVARIPYPRGGTPWLERTADTWERGVISYFGRMEPRKGVFEWIDAAVTVARERPGLRFELIGSDTPLTGSGGHSVRTALVQRVPHELRSSIVFLDGMPREQLFERLAQARMAVVPSRWENFPNTCVEAMSTGLPVLSSPEGGMVEMVEDGKTGWIARGVTPDELADALRRALDTPPAIMAEMGRAAAAAIQALCDNSRTIAQHVEFRQELIRRGPDRSRRIPAHDSSVVWDDARDAGPLTTHAAIGERRRSAAQASVGIAVAVTPVGDLAVGDCKASLANQRMSPVAIVDDLAGVSRLLSESPGPRGIVILDAGCRLDPRFIEQVDACLSADDSIGVVTMWHTRGGSGGAPMMAPAPRRPYQWLRDDVGRCGAFRTEALRAVQWALTISGGTLTPGDIALAILLDGWTGVNVPEALIDTSETHDLMRDALAATGRARLAPLLRARFPDAVAADAREILCLVQGHADVPPRPPSLGEILRMPLSKKLEVIGRAVDDPKAAMRALREVTRRAMPRPARAD